MTESICELQFRLRANALKGYIKGRKWKGEGGNRGREGGERKGSFDHCFVGKPAYSRQLTVQKNPENFDDKKPHGESILVIPSSSDLDAL